MLAWPLFSTPVVCKSFTWALRSAACWAADMTLIATVAGVALTLPSDIAATTVPGSLDDLLALDEALRRLEDVSPRQVRLVECRFFGGLSLEETAEALGVSLATVKRDWLLCRAWLNRALATADTQPNGADDPGDREPPAAS